MLDNTQYEKITEELNNLKTRLAITDFFINNFKDQDLETIRKLDELKERVYNLENKLYINFQEMENSMNSKVSALDIKISQLTTNIAPLASNSFLLFTNSMDFKKWISLLGLIISIFTGAGIVDNAVSGKISQDDLDAKLEQLQKSLE